MSEYKGNLDDYIIANYMTDRETLKTIYAWCTSNITDRSTIAPFCIEVRDLIERNSFGSEECLYTFNEMKKTKQYFIKREEKLKAILSECLPYIDVAKLRQEVEAVLNSNWCYTEQQAGR